METGIQKAVRLAGSQTALASRLKVTPQAVQKWVSQGYAPGERCREIEGELCGEVTRYELNPDVFGDPPEQHQLPANTAPADPVDSRALRESTGPGGRLPPDPSRELS